MPQRSPFEALPCIKCGENSCLALDLDDLTTFHCRECAAEFTRENVEATMAIWGLCLIWIDSAYPKEARTFKPLLPGEEGGAA